MFANGRKGPTVEPISGRFPSIGSTSSGHSSSTATAPAECRSSAATPTPSTAVSAAYSVTAPMRRQVSGSMNDSCEPASGVVTTCAITTAAIVITAAYTAENSAAMVAFATSTDVRSGVAMNVVRIMPLRYSPVTVIAARTISTGTPNTTTPIAAFSGGSGAAPYAVDPCSAARPMLSPAPAAAVHSTDRVVESLIRSASSAAATLTG